MFDSEKRNKKKRKTNDAETAGLRYEEREEGESVQYLVY